MPQAVCCFSHPRLGGLTFYQVVPSASKACLRAEQGCFIIFCAAAGTAALHTVLLCSTEGPQAGMLQPTVLWHGARAAASQSLMQKHRDRVKITQLGLEGGRPVDQLRVLLEGSRPSQRNYYRGLQGRRVWFGASQ